jgi:hypothetical protein
MDQLNLRQLLKRYRVPIIAVVASLSLGFLLLVSGLIYGSYVMVKKASSVVTAQSVQSGDATADVDGKSLGFLENLAIDITRQSMIESLRGEDVVALSDGLACLDAVGGPSPGAVMEHLRQEIKDVDVVARLNEVEQVLKQRIDQRTDGACMRWLING